MKEYSVQIKETLAMTVTVEAKSAEHARQIAELQWQNGDHVLDAEHFQGVTFTVPKDRNHER